MDVFGFRDLCQLIGMVDPHMCYTAILGKGCAKYSAAILKDMECQQRKNPAGGSQKPDVIFFCMGAKTGIAAIGGCVV